MYLDTTTSKSMVDSATNYLKKSPDELFGFLDYCDSECAAGNYFDNEKYTNMLKEYVVANSQTQHYVDEILFFHLSRRLNSTCDDYATDNLPSVLLNNNAISDLLKSHNITFLNHDDHIEMYYKGEKVSLDDENGIENKYLRVRLGYNNRMQDYCVNGFAFRDKIERNQYFNLLFHAPEIIGEIARFFNDYELINDYLSNSKYCLFTYRVPLEKVIFTNDPELNNAEKIIHIVAQTLSRIDDNRYGEDPNDHGNLLLRLDDFECMNSDYCIGCEVID